MTGIMMQQKLSLESLQDLDMSKAGVQGQGKTAKGLCAKNQGEPWKTGRQREGIAEQDISIEVTRQAVEGWGDSE